MQLVIKVLS